jgi:hypothetical protein
MPQVAACRHPKVSTRSESEQSDTAAIAAPEHPRQAVNTAIVHPPERHHHAVDVAAGRPPEHP